MPEARPSVHMIFLEDVLVLSEYPYDGWRQIQDAYPTYKASLGPYSVDDVIKYFQDDYGDNDEQWPFSRKAIHEFAQSNAVLIAAH